MKKLSFKKALSFTAALFLPLSAFAGGSISWEDAAKYIAQDGDPSLVKSVTQKYTIEPVGTGIRMGAHNGPDGGKVIPPFEFEAKEKSNSKSYLLEIKPSDDFETTKRYTVVATASESSAPAPAAQSAPAKPPVKAEIVPAAGAKGEHNGTPQGNVKVTFQDGHTEMWTKKSLARLPQISKSGLVGWARIEGDQESVRVVITESNIKTYNVDLFIDEWGFSDDSAFVVVKTRNSHGPAFYHQFDTQTGKEVASILSFTSYDQLPAWAKPYADDKPE